MSKPPKVRPSLMWCLLGLPFLAGGVAGFAYFIADGVNRLSDAFTQMTAPGSREFDFDPGRYTVFHEQRSTIDGKVYETLESIEGLECRVTSADGRTIPVRSPSIHFNYSVGGRSGHSILEFSIDRAGRYTFACDYGSSTGPAIALSVGSEVGELFQMPILKALASGFGGFLLCVGIVVGVVIANQRAKKRAYSSGA